MVNTIETLTNYCNDTPCLRDFIDEDSDLYDLYYENNCYNDPTELFSNKSKTKITLDDLNFTCIFKYGERNQKSLGRMGKRSYIDHHDILDTRMISASESFRIYSIKAGKMHKIRALDYNS